MKDEDNKDQGTANEVTKSLDELRKVESDIVELALALTRDRMEMGEIAMAMRLDTFIDHIQQALGEMPRPGEKKEDFDARREKLRKAAEAAIQAASDTPPEAMAAAKAALEEDAAPTTPEVETKDEPRCMSRAEAIGILAGMAMKRKTTLEQVEALQLAVRTLAKRMFDCQKWRKLKDERRAREAEAAKEGGAE